MQKQIYSLSTLTIFLFTFCFIQAQDQDELFETLKQKDSLLFSVGFNQCDASQFENLLSENVEFYHDQSGVNKSKTDFVMGIKNGLCKMDYKATRELVAESLKVYPMKNQGKLYGAIQTGEHRFYAKYPDKEKVLTSTALFSHLWLLEDGEWKLSRVLSYDHH